MRRDGFGDRKKKIGAESGFRSTSRFAIDLVISSSTGGDQVDISLRGAGDSPRQSKAKSGVRKER